jgi:hypothetical protein
MTTPTLTTTMSATAPNTTTSVTQPQASTETQTVGPVTACQSAQSTNSTTLSALVQVEIDPIRRGTEQVVYVTVCSAGWGVAAVRVTGTITDAAGVEQPFSGTTNENGLMSYTWQVPPGATPGMFTIVVQAVRDGYTDGWGSATFRATS